jgi:putative membrane protein
MKKLTYLMCCGALGFAALVTTTKAKAQATDQDKQFLAKASQGNYDEIHLGQLAEHKATDPAVKAFGRKMVTDHTTLDRKMKPFCDSWGLTAPTSFDSDGQSEYDKLSGLSGKEFDKEYIDDMVNDHTKDLDLFNQEVKDTHDQKFKVAVENGKSVVAAHKNMAQNLQGKL